MAQHLVKTQAQIEEEIRRQAQGAADANDEGYRIEMPRILASAEPTMHGSHWTLDFAAERGAKYVEKAAMRIARSWDLRVE